MTDRIVNLMRNLMQTIQEHRTYHLREPGAIHLSVDDAQEIAEAYRPKMTDGTEYLSVHTLMRPGDKGTLCGLPFIVDGTLPRGSVFIGYRVAAE